MERLQRHMQRRRKSDGDMKARTVGSRSDSFHSNVQLPEDACKTQQISRWSSSISSENRDHETYSPQDKVEDVAPSCAQPGDGLEQHGDGRDQRQDRQGHEEEGTDQHPQIDVQ